MNVNEKNAIIFYIHKRVSPLKDQKRSKNQKKFQKKKEK